MWHLTNVADMSRESVLYYQHHRSSPTDAFISFQTGTGKRTVLARKIAIAQFLRGGTTGLRLLLSVRVRVFFLSKINLLDA